ncbi:MAG: glycoside hydrolase family 15 protein [Candidatus Solibacter sp.]
MPIEDYALIGDCHTAALVSNRGSIDWLCLPHFDSAACFAALVGSSKNGHWTIAPAFPVRKVRRRYREGTLILETEFETDQGSVVLIDFMTPRDNRPDLIRIVSGKSGRVPMKMELVLRFDYGSIVPWVVSTDTGISAIAGPDMVSVRSSVPLRGEDLRTFAEFTVSEGEQVSFDLTWYPSTQYEPSALDIPQALRDTGEWWREWSARCSYKGKWREAVMRSLITLKALTFLPTGAIVAAPTTSLPERIGGVRNWDYRFCWVRDSTLTLDALLNAGYLDEAASWREWLLRAVAGHPAEVNIAYGIRGERRLTELELPWLSGYEGSAPVRTGNAAYNQFQLDIYGEIAATLFQCRRVGMAPIGEKRQGVVHALLSFLETAWEKPDEGIWEVRGPRRHFTHSKVMAWVAVDRAVRSMEFGWLPRNDCLPALRDRIHDQICTSGFDDGLNSFVQYYGSRHVDASLLMMPLVGFLPATDPRMVGTVAAIEKYLKSPDGFVNRYTTDPAVDGLPHGEAAFLPCTFWLADNYNLQGRREDAVETFERLLSIRNDVGLLSEEYDPVACRLVGNFPQAFSHVGIVNTAFALEPDANRTVAGPMSEGDPASADQIA